MKFVIAVFGWLDVLVRTLAIAAVGLASLLIMIVAVLNTIDVSSAALLNAPIPVVTEISSVALAVIVFAGMAHAQSRGQNVTVDLIVNHVPPSVRRVLHAVGLLVGLAMFTFLALRSTVLAMKSWGTAETAMALIPFQVYPFKIGVAIGAWIAAAEFARQSLHLVIKQTASESAERASN